MTKLDLKKELKSLYNPSAKEIQVVDVPELQFLMVDGQGNPNTAEEYQEAIEALYGTAYTLKFSLKKAAITPDYVVPPLEGLWWTDNMEDFSEQNKDIWKWTMMILQPDFITQEMVQQAVAELQKKKSLAALSKVRLDKYSEGLSAQIMYYGPYSEEGPTIARVHRFIKDSGYQLRGLHHEIYLSDPRKTAPEKLKTVIRQPMLVL